MEFALESKYINKAIGAFYILVVLLAYSTDTIMPKIATMLMIPLAILIFFINADFERLSEILPFPCWLMAGISLAYIFSIIVWLTNIEESMYIMQGSQRILFQIVNASVALSAVYIFGSKAIDYTFYGAVAMNTVRMLTGIMMFGPKQSFMDFVSTLQTGEQLGFMHHMEIQAVTYVYGMYIFYYLFVSNYPRKKRMYHVAVAVFFMFIGFKRIIFASVILTSICGFVGFKLPEKLRTKYSMLIGILVFVFSFLYVPFIKFGLFEATMNYLEIETNTRIDIYNFVRDTYSFSPTFIGRGMDFVARYLLFIKTLHLHFKGSSMHYIHNDILVHYIEMGFIGFVGWLYGNCIFILKWVEKKVGSLGGVLYAIINLYSMVNFSVGNTSRAYAYRLAWAVIVTGMVCLLGYEKKQKEKAEGEAKNADIQKTGA